jgi:hypothetical protein
VSSNAGSFLRFNWSFIPGATATFVVADIARGILGVLLFAAGVMLLFKKRVPKLIYYLQVASLVLMTMAMSLFGQLTNYQRRSCNNNILGEEFYVSDCPHVDGELLGVFLFNLMIYSAGIVAIFLIHRFVKSKASKNHKDLKLKR